MTKPAILRKELATLDQLIETHSQVLEQMLWQRYGPHEDRTLRYPKSLSEMQEADDSLRSLYEASLEVNELCWQKEIKEELLRALEVASPPLTHPNAY
jgi:hypothetical protein